MKLSTFDIEEFCPLAESGRGSVGHLKRLIKHKRGI